ncbi:nucleoid-associated protein, YbaB/EbfC family [Candidatus Marinamargulisbacteria bacterium SCGC AG-333-B06]|nr:nucleoid-associated protein, YbaB/EbfC family [Candidatus Marinamargulisbacteria bacterium SCGC AG-333-B06]
MFNQLKDMGNLAKKAKEMKSQMKKIQDELKDMKINLDESGINVTMTGEMDLVSINIDDSLMVQGKKDDLQKALVKVINKASQQSKTMASSKLSAVSKGLNIPGLT